MSLIWVMPATMPRAKLRPRAISRVNTALDKPYSLALANSRAWAWLSAISSGSNGPKVSSRAKAWSGLTSPKTWAGSTSPRAWPPHNCLRPARSAAAIFPNRPSSWLWLTTGPITVSALAGSPVLSLRTRSTTRAEVGIQRAVDNDPVDAHADLALMQEASDDCGMRRYLDVRIFQHHQRRVTAQLQGHALDVLAAGGDAPDITSHVGGAGEGNQARYRVLDERIANLRTRADHHVQRARREPGLFEQMGNQQAAGNRRITGGLEHHGIAQRKGRHHRAHAQVQREVPRADHTDHPQRLAKHEALFARLVAGQNPAFNLHRQRCAFANQVEGELPFHARLDAGTAGLADQPVDDFFAAVLDDLGEFFQLRTALGRVQRRPVGLRALGGLVGVIQVGHRGQGHFQQGFAVEGVTVVQASCRTTCTPGAVDVLIAVDGVGREYWSCHSLTLEAGSRVD